MTIDVRLTMDFRRDVHGLTNDASRISTTTYAQLALSSLLLLILLSNQQSNLFPFPVTFYYDDDDDDNDHDDDDDDDDANRLISADEEKEGSGGGVARYKHWGPTFGPNLNLHDNWRKRMNRLT
jgi:hypothetical protein